MASIREEVADAIEAIRRDGTNESAWASFYLGLRPTVAYLLFVRGVRLGLVLRRHEIEELCQDVFYRFLRYSPWRRDWQALPSAGVVGAYIAAVTRSVLVDHFSVHSAEVKSRYLAEAKIASDDAQAQAGEEVEAHAEVAELLKGLKVEERRLLQGLIDGHALAEVAQNLGISYSAAGVRLHRLKRKLRRSRP